MNVGTAFEQVRRKTVAQRVQRDWLLDGSGGDRLMEQASQLPGCDVVIALSSRKQPAILHWDIPVEKRQAGLPPLAQQFKDIGREHDMEVLTALGLNDPNDSLCTVDVADFEAHSLAGAQATPIAECEEHMGSGVFGHRQQALGLYCAHDQWDLLRLPDVIDLVDQIHPPERDAKQELHPGHDPIAIADTCALLHKVQLEQ